MALQNINNLQAEGSLAADISDSATILDVGVGEGANFPSSDSVILVDDELIWYTTRTGDQFSGLTRGFDGTVAAGHTAGATVAFKVSAAWFNEVASRQLPTPDLASALLFQTSSVTVGSLYSGTEPTVTALGVQFQSAALRDVLDNDGHFVKVGLEGVASDRIAFEFPGAYSPARIRVDNNEAGNHAQRYEIWYSQNGADWTFLQSAVAVRDGYTTIDLEQLVSAVHWAIVPRYDLYGNDPSDAGCSIQHVEFYDGSGDVGWDALEPGPFTTQVVEPNITGKRLEEASNVSFDPAKTGLQYQAAATLGASWTGPRPVVHLTAPYGSNWPALAAWPVAKGGEVGNAISDGAGQSVEFEFDEAVAFGQVQFDQHSTLFASVVAVDYSTDGVSWVELASQSGLVGSSNQTITFTGNAVTARFWRLRFVTLNSTRVEFSEVDWFEADVTGQWVSADLPEALAEGNDGDTLVYVTDSYEVGSQVSSSPTPYIFADSNLLNTPGHVWPGVSGDFATGQTFAQAYIAFKFASAQRFAQVEWDQANASLLFERCRVEKSDDGVNWELVAEEPVSVTHDTTGTQRFDFSSTPGLPEAVYWRIVNIGNLGNVQIGEVRWFLASAVVGGGAWVPTDDLLNTLPASASLNSHLTFSETYRAGDPTDMTGATYTASVTKFGAVANLKTFNSSNWLGEGVGDTIDIDMVTPHRFAAVELSNGDSARALTGFKIYVSDDGTNYAQIGEEFTVPVANGGYLQRIALPPDAGEHRYWRLEVTAHAGTDVLLIYLTFNDAEGLVSTWTSREVASVAEDLRESLRLLTGTGTPEGAVTAGVGTLFLRTDGGTSTTLYVKESGTGNTGWVAK